MVWPRHGISPSLGKRRRLRFTATLLVCVAPPACGVVYRNGVQEVKLESKTALARLPFFVSRLAIASGVLGTFRVRLVA